MPGGVQESKQHGGGGVHAWGGGHVCLGEWGMDAQGERASVPGGHAWDTQIPCGQIVPFDTRL